MSLMLMIWHAVFDCHVTYVQLRTSVCETYSNAVFLYAHIQYVYIHLNVCISAPDCVSNPGSI